jgi:DNA processing protein
MSGPLLSEEAVPGDDRAARVALSRLGEPGAADVHDLVARFGAVEALGMLVRGDRTARGVSAVRFSADRLTEDLRHTDRLGARVVVPSDEEWPDEVDALPVPPLCLWVRGPALLSEVSARSVAIVGARSATAYGTQVAADLAAGLCERGFAVVSGAAFGIDAAAHRGALATDGVTVAVLAGGIDRLYPSSHARLLGEIARVGAVLTEQPPGVAPIGSRFLARNRIIAAMTCGTVVVEASLRSGSLNTAGHAITAHRPVAAVPGPVTSVQSAGCHAMIRDAKAELVTDAAEVAALLGRMGLDLDPVKRGESRPADDLDDDLRRLWEVLPIRAFAALVALSEAAHLPERQVRSGLGRLLARGDAETDGLDGWRKATPDTRRGR